MENPITAKLAYEIATDFSNSKALSSVVDTILEKIEKKAYQGYLTYRSSEINAYYGESYYNSVINFFKNLGYTISKEDKTKYYYFFTLSWGNIKKAEE